MRKNVRLSGSGAGRVVSSATQIQPRRDRSNSVIVIREHGAAQSAETFHQAVEIDRRRRQKDVRAGVGGGRWSVPA